MEIQNRSNAPLTMPVKLYEQSEYSDVQKDFILPNTTEDIKKLLHHTLTLRQDRTFIPAAQPGSTVQAEYSGEMLCQVLFLTELGDTDSVSFSFPYSGSCQVTVTDGAGDVAVSPEQVSVRLCNPRKIGVKVRLCADAVAFGSEDLTPKVQWQGEQRAADGVYGYAVGCEGVSRSKNNYGGITFSHDIELESSAPTLEKVLYHTATGTVTKASAGDDGYDVEGELRLTFLCLPEQATGQAAEPEAGVLAAPELYTLIRTLPFSEHIAVADYGQKTMPQGSPALFPTVTVESVQVNVAENDFGERKLLETDIGVSIGMETAENVACATVSDLYSTRYPDEVTWRSVTADTLQGQVNEGVSVSVAGNCEEPLCCFAAAGQPRTVKEEDGLYAEIPVTVCTLYREESGSISAEEQGELVRQKLCDSNADTEAALHASVRELRWDKSGATVDLMLQGLLFRQAEKKTAESILLQGAEPYGKPDARLVFYYPAEDTDRYQVAKRYHTEPVKVSGGEDGILPAGEPVTVLL